MVDTYQTKDAKHELTCNWTNQVFMLTFYNEETKHSLFITKEQVNFLIDEVDFFKLD